MQNKLSYYSVILLVGLVAASGLVLAVNPFNGVPASASPLAQNGASASNSTASAGPGGVPSNSQSPAAGFGGFHHEGRGDADGGRGFGQFGTNSTTSTTTSTTTAAAIYSYND